MSVVLRKLLVVLALVLPVAALAQGKTEVTWLGHSAFKIRTPSGGVLVIDPWVLNPYNPNAIAAMRQLDKVDYLLISHGHQNAVGDAADIVKKTGARLITADRLERNMIYNKKFTKQNFVKKSLRPWDSIDLLDGEVNVTVTPARHLGAGENEADAKMRNNAAYAGAYGFIISIAGGPTIYHTGDTKFIKEFELVGQRQRIDLMLLAVDAKHVMTPEEAAEAVALVRPRSVVPMRFEDASPGSVAALETELRSIGSDALLRPMKVGETLSF